MKLNLLGAGDLVISEMVLGCMRFGKDTDEKTSLSIVSEYLAAGGNLLDTADCYSDGESERICGVARRCFGDDLLIATKTGRPFGSEDRGGYSPTRLRRQVDESLQRLNVDRIDLYFLHQWDPSTSIEDAVEVLEDLCVAGKIKEYGFSNMPSWELGAARLAAKLTGARSPVAYQYHYSVACRDIESDILPLCESSNVGLLAWSPLSGGLLTGKHLDGVASGRGAGVVGRRGYAFERLVDQHGELVDQLVALAIETDTTPGELAIRWLLAQPAVRGLVFGARSELHVRANCLPSGNSIPEEVFARLSDLISPQPRYPYDFLDTVLAERDAVLPAV